MLTSVSRMTRILAIFLLLNILALWAFTLSLNDKVLTADHEHYCAGKIHSHPNVSEHEHDYAEAFHDHSTVARHGHDYAESRHDHDYAESRHDHSVLGDPRFSEISHSHDEMHNHGYDELHTHGYGELHTHGYGELHRH